MINWELLVVQRDEWVAKNFTPGPAFIQSEVQKDTVLGVVEEIGELAHSHLKQSQGIRGDSLTHEENGQDAIGDLIVYLLGVMSKVGTPKTDFMRKKNTALDTLLYLAARVGYLCERQSIYDVEHIIAVAKGYCDQRNWDFESIVTQTWEAVKHRDWKANPEDGTVPAT